MASSNRASHPGRRRPGPRKAEAAGLAMPGQGTIEAIRGRLLAWYRQHRRDLPWRSDRPNAYHVMVSEAMLQQTQVATVIAYFHRFMKALPTVQALASASEQQVLTLWQGLGYYRRARSLHAAAKAVVADHRGQVPRTVEELLTLPGVGRYTAGAIASIAHGEPAPIVDGNVVRVLARLLAIQQSPDDKQVRDHLWAVAGALVPADAAGDFNQAMMELGAMVCTPRQPQCLICPVNEACQARAMGLADRLPVKVERKKPKAVEHHIIAIESKGQWLFEQRPAKGLWSNMWQMPTAEELPAGDGAVGDALARWLKQTRDLSTGTITRQASFTHQTTHRTITFTLWTCKLKGPRRASSDGVVWRGLDDLDDLPLSNPQVRAVKCLTKTPE